MRRKYVFRFKWIWFLISSEINIVRTKKESNDVTTFDKSKQRLFHSFRCFKIERG